MKIKKALFIIIPIVILIAVSILNIYSASVSQDKMMGSEQLEIQIISVSLGALAIAVIVLLPPMKKRVSPLISFVLPDILALIFLVLPVFVGVGNGNKNWIMLPYVGLYAQPAEIVKIVFIVNIARHMTMVIRERSKVLWYLSLILHMAAYVVCIAIQGDVGTAGVYVLIFLSMLLCSSIKNIIKGISFGCVGASLPLVWLVMGESRRERIIAGFNPASDPKGYGWQALISMDAIKNGGLFGVGYMKAEIAPIIPACCTDMIFARICEEFGIIFAIMVALVLVFIVANLFIMAYFEKDEWVRLVFCGFAAWIMWQTIESVGMNVGLLPIVGVTLPFVSYGGSSMLGLLAGAGVILRLAIRKKPILTNTDSDDIITESV